MSALARYFNQKGLHVAGYDRVPSSLTNQLMSEGMDIHFEDNTDLIPEKFRQKDNTLVIFTPALNADHSELKYFRDNNFRVEKRSAVLGSITSEGKGVAVAGTHGKTTISGMIAHIFQSSGMGCNAFLGGICKNFDSNYVLNTDSNLFVVEADEYDRSFLTLHPQIALITAIDPDHLDIYGDIEKMKSSFETFVSQVKTSGILILKQGITMKVPPGIRILYYSMSEEADYYAFNIERKHLNYSFSLHTPAGDFHNLKTGIFGRINVENSVAAFAVTMEAGVPPEEINKAITSYEGVKRRFDIVIQSEKLIFIDDYAHHPEELKAFISSVNETFPGRKITGIFQPHLFSRTKDFAAEFAASLSLMDDVLLLDIYPAREKPVEGVSSELIFKQLTNKGQRIMCKMDELTHIVENIVPEVLLCMGAGDIDKAVAPLHKSLEKMI